MTFVSVSSYSIFLLFFKVILYFLVIRFAIRIAFKLYRKSKYTSGNSNTFEEVNLEDDISTIRAKKTFERGGIQQINSVPIPKKEGKNTIVKDDLQKIKGIGPNTERTLNLMGIYTYSHLTKLTKREIRILKNSLKYFKGRVEKEDWVKQAKKLIKNKE